MRTKSASTLSLTFRTESVKQTSCTAVSFGVYPLLCPITVRTSLEESKDALILDFTSTISPLELDTGRAPTQCK